MEDDSELDLVGTIDNAIPSSIQLFMANRAHAHITEVKAGHLSMISQPDAVTKVILEAAQSVAALRHGKSDNRQALGSNQAVDEQRQPQEPPGTEGARHPA